jgi:hypothetical protein
VGVPEKGERPGSRAAGIVIRKRAASLSVRPVLQGGAEWSAKWPVRPLDPPRD